MPPVFGKESGMLLKDLHASFLRHGSMLFLLSGGLNREV